MPMNPYRQALGRYLECVTARWERGRVEYGDRSYSAPSQDLLAEIQQELEDVAAWSAILWHRIDRLRDALRQSDRGAMVRHDDMQRGPKE